MGNRYARDNPHADVVFDQWDWRLMLVDLESMCAAADWGLGNSSPLRVTLHQARALAKELIV